MEEEMRKFFKFGCPCGRTHEVLITMTPPMLLSDERDEGPESSHTVTIEASLEWKGPSLKFEYLGSD